MERSRLLTADPTMRLLQGDNIWNVSVLDNIDFKQKTFMRGNIFNATRNTSHATLRMVFQFTLQESLTEVTNRPSADTKAEELFGKSLYTEMHIELCQLTINQ